jgi:hypothetical protein
MTEDKNPNEKKVSTTCMWTGLNIVKMSKNDCKRCVFSDCKGKEEPQSMDCYIDDVFTHTITLCDEIIDKHDCQSQWGFNAMLIKKKIDYIKNQKVKCNG